MQQGKDCIIRNYCVIKDDVVIGDNCHIGDFTLIREGVRLGNNVSIGGHSTIEINVTIGDNTNIQGSSVICEHSKIGANVFIGPMFVNPADNGIGISFSNNKKYVPNPAIIEDNCRIGARVTLKPGITIRKGTTIGMGSLVTKTTEENSFYYGYPAVRKKNENNNN